MKKVFLSVMAMSFAVLVSAETPTPEFKNQPMLLKGGKLEKLEKQTIEIKQSVHALGYGGVSTNIHLDGKKSDVRTSNKPEFVLKTDVDTDPETLYYLTITKEKKNGRDIEMQKQSAFAVYGAQGKSVKRFRLKLDFEKISDGVYKIKTHEPLEEGEEYAFVSSSQGASGQGAGNGNSIVYAFGVGAKNK